jgi:putative sugar O-methyltransferase
MNSAPTNASNIVIADDIELLDLMLGDNRTVPEIYQPGKYWAYKAKNAVKEIKKFGLNNFRGDDNSIGTSFADNLYCDVRTQLSYGIRKPFKILLNHVLPFKQIFNAQRKLTREYAQNMVDLRGYIYSTTPQIAELLQKYNMPYSMRGGCLDFFEYKGQKIAHYYASLLLMHDAISKNVDFSTARSFFEIGGGFGVNLHLLVENYSNLRKFIYLDIPPNLYVGTQYLKSFYGDSIKDYRSTRNMHEIRFSDNDELEIFCIAPWQIERLKSGVDIFHNAHSFVEMTSAIVQNYSKHIERLPGYANTTIVLVSYDWGSMETTLDPDRLQSYFAKRFVKAQQEIMADNKRKYLIYVGK